MSLLSLRFSKFLREETLGAEDKKAIRDLIGAAVSVAAQTAATTAFDPVPSGMTATDVQAAIEEVLAAVEGVNSAEEISFDGGVSGLTAANIQDAIDEIFLLIADASSEVFYDNSTSGLTATDVQEAIDELAAALGSGEGHEHAGYLTENNFPAYFQANFENPQTPAPILGPVHLYEVVVGTGNRTNAVITLTADSEINVKAFDAGQGGIITVNQDGTGGWALSALHANPIRVTVLYGDLNDFANMGPDEVAEIEWYSPDGTDLHAWIHIETPPGGQVPPVEGDVYSVRSWYWTDPGTWSDYTAPSLSHDYIIDGETVYFSTGENYADDSYAFPGNSLTLESGTIRIVSVNDYPGGDLVKIPGFTMESGTIYFWVETQANCYFDILTPIVFGGAGDSDLILYHPAPVSQISYEVYFYAPISGSGDVNFTQIYTTSPGIGHFYLNTSCPDYSGDIRVLGCVLHLGAATVLPSSDIRVAHGEDADPGPGSLYLDHKSGLAGMSSSRTLTIVAGSLGCLRDGTSIGGAVRFEAATTDGDVGTLYMPEGSLSFYSLFFTDVTNDLQVPAGDYTATELLAAVGGAGISFSLSGPGTIDDLGTITVLN